MDTMDMEQLSAFWPIILMVIIFYFMLWRPQKKQQKQRQEMLDSLKAGVKVITAGGIYGTVVALHDDYLIIRVADKVEIKLTRNAISQVLGKADRSEIKKAKKADKKAEHKLAESAQDNAESADAEPNTAAAPADEKKTEDTPRDAT